MSRTEQLHRGMVIHFEGQHYVVLDFHTAQTGKQKPSVHLKMRSVKGGHTTEKTLEQLGKLEERASEVRHMQYLYAAGKNRVFMDGESFEQHSLNEDIIGEAADFLVDGDSYRVLTIEDELVSLQLPAIVAMDVVDTAAVEHAGGSSNVYKEARLASGLVIQVPLFIRNGDRIKIGTDKHDYQGKDHH